MATGRTAQGRSGTSTLLSLRLRPFDAGCVVTPNVDEFPASACGVELEDLWLSILERLRAEVSS